MKRVDSRLEKSQKRTTRVGEKTPEVRAYNTYERQISVKSEAKDRQNPEVSGRTTRMSEHVRAKLSGEAEETPEVRAYNTYEWQK